MVQIDDMDLDAAGFLLSSWCKRIVQPKSYACVFVRIHILLCPLIYSQTVLQGSELELGLDRSNALDGSVRHINGESLEFPVWGFTSVAF
jgi:hypothetical protein